MSVALFGIKVGRGGKVSFGGVGGIVTLMEDVLQTGISLPVGKEVSHLSHQEDVRREVGVV